MYRACSFPVLKLYQNTTIHLHISHTCNFLPAVTRGHQGLENIPKRQKERVEFPAGTPRLKSSSSQGRCCHSPMSSDQAPPLTSAKCKTPPRKQKASYCFSPLCSLLATTRKTSITSTFFPKNDLHLSLLLCSALEIPQNTRNRKKSLCWVVSPSVSCMVFLEIFLVVAQSASVDFNHAEVIRNSHDYCQFSSHTSFAKTSIKTI